MGGFDEAVREVLKGSESIDLFLVEFGFVFVAQVLSFGFVFFFEGVGEVRSSSRCRSVFSFVGEHLFGDGAFSHGAELVDLLNEFLALIEQ